MEGEADGRGFRASGRMTFVTTWMIPFEHSMFLRTLMTTGSSAGGTLPAPCWTKLEPMHRVWVCSPFAIFTALPHTEGSELDKYNSWFGTMCSNMISSATSLPAAISA